MTIRLCLYVIGGAPPAVAADHGDYDDWFLRLLAPHELDVTAVDGRSMGVPNLDTYDAFVITGSPASMTRPEPWMEAAVELVRHCYQDRVPLLGVCFGHQVIGAAFGGSVVPNPRGWHVGTRVVTVVDGAGVDPLFEGLEPSFDVNVCHEDVVDPDTLAPQNGVHIIAGTDRARAAVIAAGPAVRGVQFHPEFDGGITRAYVEQHRGALESQAANKRREHPDVTAAAAVDCPAAEVMFHNFVRNFVVTQSWT